MMVAPVTCCRRPRLFSWLHIEPEELMVFTEDRFQRPGLASRASSIGVEKARPTRTMPVACSRSASFHSSMALNLREGRATTVPPLLRVMMAENWPVPCISGAAMMLIGRRWSGAAWRAMSSGMEVTGGRPSAALPPAPRTWNRSS